MRFFISLALIAWGLCAQTSTGPACCRDQKGSTSLSPGADRGMGQHMMMNGMFSPLPRAMESAENPLTAAKVALGRKLFFETRLSKNGRISCNSCHDLKSYGVDGQPTSPGYENKRGNRNSPTVFNAAGHLAQFWDGRAPTVEEQAKGPILNPVEMGLPSEQAALTALRAVPEYPAMFRAAFPNDGEPLTFQNLATAIGAFERTLVTPSRWDDYLQGDAQALTADERRGLHTFMMSGCAQCHNGTYVGGSAYKMLGEKKRYPDQTDVGRFGVTKRKEDRMLFKVPSLRNVERTGPYFHNGEVASLEDAVSRMGEFQLGKTLSADEVRSIVTWLKTLTSTTIGENPLRLP